MMNKLLFAIIIAMVIGTIACGDKKDPNPTPAPVATPTPAPSPIVGDAKTGCVTDECPKTQDAKFWYLLGQVRGGEKVTAPELERRIREQVEAVGGAKAATEIAEMKAKIAERDREEARQKLAILESELAARRRQPGHRTGCERLSGHAREICERL